MKFGKKLQRLLDNALPVWRPNFLCYKQLKKLLNQLGKEASAAFLIELFPSPLVDENESIEDEFLISGTVDELSGGEEREAEVGQKRKIDDGFVFEEQKKHKSEEQEQEQEASSPRRFTEKDENFLRLVNTELHKFNAFFMEMEEEFLIRLYNLEMRTKSVKAKRVQSGGVCDRATYEELIQVHKLIVTLHGEMVLLMNYSSLNYVGLVKILKKFDKHTKSNLRQMVHKIVLQQPFFSLANLKDMLQRSLTCDDSLQSVFPISENIVEPMGSSLGLAKDVAFIGDISQYEPLPRHIRAALEAMQEI